ncbi:hypothetical protein I3842_08G142100 [Carya illinoinensis]|uniref:Uncharacterized protein n=1 Tax=Carya illinoinensis TaxID=32201 RepID=A0A922EFP7_CARIL|nr:hypothetical protein I3842_08G142100 [Carya illinoinensis]
MSTLVQIQETPRWKKLLGHVGPGILVSVGYLDPGNLESDLQAGADHKYELLWIVLLGLTFAFIIQCCSARLGVATVLGTAFALNILFRIPMWSGVLLAGLNTLLLHGMQRYGIRKLEGAIGMLVMVVGGCFFAVMIKASPSAKEMVTGMFVPKLNAKGATIDAIALLGALIMP